MGDSIRDELVNAFAEAGKEVPVVEDASASSPPADAPSVEAPSPAESPSNRSPDGKFKAADAPNENAGASEAAKHAKTATDLAEATGDPAPQDTVKYPQSWKAEMKAEFTTLPPKVQEYILQREKESTSSFGKTKSELDRVRNEHAEIDQVIEPFRERLALAGERPAQAVQRLVAAQLYLERAPQEAIAWLAKSYGVDLGTLTQAPQQQAPNDPVVQRIQQLENLITGQQRQAQGQMMTGIVSEIEKFAQTAEFFEDVKDEMPAIVQLVKSQNPTMANQEVLKTAYDRAVYGNPHTRTLMMKKQEAERNGERARLAKEAERKGLSVTGNPSGMPAAQEDDSLRGQLQAAFRQHRVS